jgi:hypothetical protein
MKKKLIILFVIGFFILVFIGLSSGNKETQESFKKGMEQGKNVAQGSKLTPATPEQTIEAKIRSALPQQKTNNNKDIIREITVTKQVDGNYGVLVSFNANQSVSGDMAKKSIWITMTKIYTALYKDSSNVGQVSQVAYATLVDNYGKEQDNVVMKTSLDKTEGGKVNWGESESTLALQILPDVWKYDFNRYK